ncbi:hypothetical protein A5gp_00073 [Alteromonas phage vB_AemP_PT15-A5]|nr:hypothetical protein A5gp_00073 [Alteromonas phage vB_AemP_PT15-A5]
MNIPMNGMTFTILLCAIFVLAVALYSVVEHYKAKVMHIKTDLANQLATNTSLQKYVGGVRDRENDTKALVFNERLKEINYVLDTVVEPVAQKHPENVHVAHIYNKLVMKKDRIHNFYMQYKEDANDNRD